MIEAYCLGVTKARGDKWSVQGTQLVTIKVTYFTQLVQIRLTLGLSKTDYRYVISVKLPVFHNMKIFAYKRPLLKKCFYML